MFYFKEYYSIKIRGEVETDIKAKERTWIGFGFPECIDKKREKGLFCNSGQIVFGHNVRLGPGCRIDNEGQIRFGDNTCITATAKIICRKEIRIGNDCLVSWNCLLMDTDFHNVMCLNKKGNKDRKIVIENHVWICCNVMILKGTYIACDNVIAAGSILANETFGEKNSVITSDGYMKKNITWSK